MRVNGRRWPGLAAANGYVAIDSRVEGRGSGGCRSADDARASSRCPGTPDVVAFVYGPIVLAGRLGEEGLAPGNQIIVNERESGTMLNTSVAVPVLVGDVSTMARHIRQDAHDPLTFRSSGIGRPNDVELVPYYRLAHERYNLYWQLVSG